jgi:hypothetical protein
MGRRSRFALIGREKSVKKGGKSETKVLEQAHIVWRISVGQV